MRIITAIFRFISGLRPLTLGLVLFAAGWLPSPVLAQAGSNPAEIFNAAQDAHEKGNLRGAISLYKEALEAFPQFPEAEFQMGNAFQQLGNREEAEKCYRRALVIRPTWILPMLGLARLRALRGDYMEAETLTREAIRAGEDGEAYSVLVEILIAKKASDEDIEETLAAIKRLNSPPASNVALLISQSMLERRLGDFRSASETIAAALKLEPEKEDVLFESFEAALGSRDTDTALDRADRLIKLTKGSDRSRVCMARAQALAGDPQKALEQLNLVKTRNAVTEDLRKELEVAAASDPIELEKSLATNAQDLSVMGRLCVLYRTKNPSKAVEYCRIVLQSEPSNITHATRYAAALVQAQQYAQAESILTQLKKAAPENYTARAYLATVFFQTKRWSEARAEYSWLLQRQPTNAITSYMLGIVNDRLGEYVGALSHYQNFLAMADPEAHKLEIEKVKLRLPSLLKQVKEKKGR